MTNRMHRAAVAALLPLAFSLASAVPGFAGVQSAPDPRVQITPAQAATFFSAFTALAQQAHVALVAEDHPLYTTLTHSQAARLKLNQDGEPLSTLLPKLAAAYDYDVQPSGTVFLLKKRYTDAADLPSITVKECALALEETNRYAENFNPHLVLGLPDRSPAVRDLIYSLTPTQLAAMGDIHRGVPVASLSPIQQEEVQQFLLHLYVQTAITDLPNAVGAINRVSATDPRFSWRSLAQIEPSLARYDPQGNNPLFGYNTTDDAGRRIFITMSKPSQIKVYFTAGIRMSHGSPAVNRPLGEYQKSGPYQAEAAPTVWQISPGDVTDPLPPCPMPPRPPRPSAPPWATSSPN